MKIQLIALSLLIASCSAQKRIEKAKQIVLTNKPAFDSVGHIWAWLNPCATDTTITSKIDTIQGESFYYIDTTTVHDSTVKTKTLVKVQKQIIRQMAYVADYRQIRILEKDIEKLSIENANLRTNIAQKDLQIKAENKRGNNYVFWLIVACIALAVSLFTIIYKTIRKQ